MCWAPFQVLGTWQQTEPGSLPSRARRPHREEWTTNNKHNTQVKYVVPQRAMGLQEKTARRVGSTRRGVGGQAGNWGSV